MNISRKNFFIGTLASAAATTLSAAVMEPVGNLPNENAPTYQMKTRQLTK